MYKTGKKEPEQNAPAKSLPYKALTLDLHHPGPTVGKKTGYPTHKANTRPNSPFSPQTVNPHHCNH
jgi:hypothetical protein